MIKFSYQTYEVRAIIIVLVSSRCCNRMKSKRSLLLTVLADRKSKTEAQADFTFGESLLLGS